MKIIISDYDGTIFEDEITTKKNIAAIAKFRNQNLFAVATGRSYEDFMSAKIKNNIEFIEDLFCTLKINLRRYKLLSV